jgi:hypothetical protein
MRHIVPMGLVPGYIRVVRQSWLFALSSAVLLLASCSDPFNLGRSEVPTDELRQSCMDSARLLIGSGAELIRFGHLSKGAPLECVAILRSPKASRTGGTPVASLSILRHDGATWVRVFEANREMRNPEGYVGLDYIDDGWIKAQTIRIDSLFTSRCWAPIPVGRPKSDGISPLDVIRSLATTQPQNTSSSSPN